MGGLLGTPELLFKVYLKRKDNSMKKRNANARGKQLKDRTAGNLRIFTSKSLEAMNILITIAYSRLRIIIWKDDPGLPK